MIYNQILSIANTSRTVGVVLQRISIAASTSIRPRLHSPLRSALRSAGSYVLAVAALTSLAGCGNTYRPVVSAINPVGPAGQPQKFAVAVSTPSASSPGLVTIVDYSGDTVLITANVGVNPYYFNLNSSGTTGYTLNSDGTVTSFDISTQLQTRDVLQTTLLSGANPASVFVTGGTVYIPEPGRNAIAELQGSPATLRQELPVAANAVYVVGINNGARLYALSQGTAGSVGQAAAIDTATTTITTTIPVGRGPVYGVMTADGKRAFVMNQLDNTVSVINAQTNQLDTPNGTIPVGVNPLWADFAPTRSELVVANAGNGTTPGSVTLINIPLCSAAALPTNPNCSATNPVDSTDFGKVIANIPTGLNTVMVSVLQDGTRAYVANTGDPTLPCAAPPAVPGVSTICSISVVNLTTNTVTQTLYALPDSQCTSVTTPAICGHPAYIVATTGAPTGKVYVVSRDSNNMSVIRTDTDTVTTTIPLQGKGVSVRLTTQ